MTKEEIFQRLLDLPAPVQDYIFSEDSGELNGKIIANNGLGDAQLPLFFDLLKELFVGEVKPDTLAPEIQRRLSFDSVKAKQLAMDIAGYRLLPLDQFLGDITAYIRLLGGDPKSYPATRVRVEERTPDQAAADVVGASGNTFDHRMKERLNDIINSFYRGVRTEKQLLEILKKSIKTGGMELSDEAANRLLEQVRAEASAVHIREAAAKPPEPVSPVPPVPGTKGTGIEKKSDAFVTIAPEDDREIQDLKASVLPVRGGDQAAHTANKIERSVEELYQATGILPPDEAMQKRLKTIIGNRLRDVRDSMETLETLVQPKELGGAGLSQDEGRRVLGLIESKLKAVHEAHAADTETKKAEWMQSEAAKQSAKEIGEQVKEETELADLYRSVVSKSKKVKNIPPPVSPALAMARMTAAATPPPAASAPPANLPIVGAAPARSVPMSPPLKGEVAKPEGSRLTPALSFREGVMPSAPPVLKPPLTVVRPAQVPPVPMQGASAPTGRPKMEDVKYVAKLTGPVEELRATTLVDFRRLSKDPKEAAAKIKDKIDLLAEQSYSRRTEGIKAWLESEVHRTYLEMMREALEGTPMPQVIASRQNSKKTVLSPEELQTVAELSRNLRY